MTRITKRTFLILWASAVFFICAGTLINFHQHKIWGKPLLPQLLYTKRDKEDLNTLLKDVKTDVPSHDGSTFPVLFAAIIDQPYQVSEVLLFDIKPDVPILVRDQIYLFTGAFRAPPAA
ncbi:MAG: hypothetical protein WCL00_10575 [Bacteroidota bacterium]